MHILMRRKAWAAAAIFVALAVSIGTAYAHEGREVGEYRLVVGFAVEPAYEGLINGVEVRVTRVADEGEGSGHHEDDSGGMSMGGGHHGEADAVEGLDETLQAEITHVSTGASRVLSLRADVYEPGRYIGDLIPTTPGVYQIRLFGAIEGNLVDETFISRGGGGGFDDIRSATALHFPETLPELRELESAVRGAMSTAQQAQDAALAASEGDDDSDGPLLVAAITLGAAGVLLGVAGLAMGVRLSRRRG